MGGRKPSDPTLWTRAPRWVDARVIGPWHSEMTANLLMRKGPNFRNFLPRQHAFDGVLTPDSGHERSPGAGLHAAFKFTGHRHDPQAARDPKVTPSASGRPAMSVPGAPRRRESLVEEEPTQRIVDWSGLCGRSAQAAQKNLRPHHGNFLHCTPFINQSLHKTIVGGWS
jgi:hypothetical protein